MVWQASIYFPTVLQNLGMYNMNFSDKAARDHFKTTGKLHRSGTLSIQSQRGI